MSTVVNSIVWWIGAVQGALWLLDNTLKAYSFRFHAWSALRRIRDLHAWDRLTGRI